MAGEYAMDCGCCGGCKIYVANPGALKLKQASLQQRGFIPFLNAHEYVRAGTSQIAGYVDAIRLTYADVNAIDFTVAARSTGLGVQAAFESPAIVQADVALHPILGNIYATTFTAGAWRDVASPVYPVRTTMWTGGITAHTTGQIIRRRDGPDAGSFFRRKALGSINPDTGIDITHPVGGMLSGDPAVRPDWWEPIDDHVFTPGDAEVVNSFIAGEFDDYANFATFRDFKFELINSVVQRYSVAREGFITGDPNGDAHLGARVATSMAGRNLVDAQQPDPQTIDAITSGTGLQAGIIATDSSLPNRYTRRRTRSRLVSMWGYNRGFSSVTSTADSEDVHDWTVVREDVLNPITGAQTMESQTAYDHPLADPADVVLGSGQIGSIDIYLAVTPGTDKTNSAAWDGAKPVFMRPGEYIEARYWLDTDTAFGWKLFQVTRWYAPGGAFWPIPGGNGLTDVNTRENYIDLPEPVVAFSVTDRRTMAQVAPLLWPNFPTVPNGLAEAQTKFFSSEPTEQIVHATGFALDWCDVSVTIDGAPAGTFAVSPQVVLIQEQRLRDVWARSQMFSYLDGLDDGTVPPDCGGWQAFITPQFRNGNPPVGTTRTFTFVPQQVIGAVASRVFRARLCYSHYWPHAITTRWSDGTSSCIGAPMIPGRAFEQTVNPRGQRFFEEVITGAPVDCSRDPSVPYQTRLIEGVGFRHVAINTNAECV